MLKRNLTRGTVFHICVVAPAEAAIRNRAVFLFFLSEKHENTDVYCGCESFLMEMTLKN